MESIELTYTGAPRLVGALAQELEGQGVSVDYERPFETKDLAGSLAVVTVVLTATGPLPDIVEGVLSFRSRFKGPQVEGLPEAGQTVTDRLAVVDQLHKDGTISDSEHAQQRERILGEL